MGCVLRRKHHSRSSELGIKGPEFWMQGCQGDLGQVTSLLCASAAINLYSVPTMCQEIGRAHV